MFTSWRADGNGEPSRSCAERRRAPGHDPGALVAPAFGAFPSLLHQADGLDGLRLGGIHVAGLAGSLSLTDQLGRVGAAALRAGERPRGLNILRAATRGLNILGAAARGLHVLRAAARRLDVLRAAARSLDILRAATRRLDLRVDSILRVG